MPDGPEYTRDPLIRAFGKVLRSHREAAGLSRPQLAKALGCAPGWIEKLETAQRPPSKATAEDLDVYFGNSAQTFVMMWLEIKREGKHLAAPPGFSEYASREQRALSIRRYSAHLVPGLLQTPDYVRAVLGSGYPADIVEERFADRMARQQVFAREKPPRMWCVIDEAVLHRPVGGKKVMREQLEQLLKTDIESPHIQVRIFPFSSVTYATFDGSFTLLEMPEGGCVAHCEGPETSNLIENPAVVAECTVRFDLAMGEALRSSESRDLLMRTLENYK